MLDLLLTFALLVVVEGALHRGAFDLPLPRRTP
jgi:hypothetical protein